MRVSGRWDGRGLVLALLLAGAQLAAAQSGGPAGAAPDPFEPVVTAREADLLQAAMAQAGTNLAAAVSLLEREDRAHGSAALDYALGNLYAQTNRLTDAEFAYREALRKLPRFRSALNNLARVCLMQERAGPAQEALAALVRDGQGDADTYLLLGHAFSLLEQSVSAEGAYRQALLLRAGDGEACRGLVRVLLGQQRYAEAEALLREMLMAAPQNDDLWALRAGAAATQGRHEEAIAQLETARRLGSATPDMLATLGDLYLDAGQADDAVAAYDAAFPPDQAATPRSRRAIAALLAADQTDAAVTLLERATGAAADAGTDAVEARAWRRLRADVARSRGDSAGALAQYQSLLREDPLDGESLLTVGDLHRERGQSEEAAMVYERAARIGGFEVRALVRQAQVEVERGRYASAVDLLERAQSFQDQPHVARYLDQVRRLARE